MFKKETILDRTELPAQIKHWLDEGFGEQVNSNDSFIKIWPEEVLYQPGLVNEDEALGLWDMRVMTWEEYSDGSEISDSLIAQYKFLSWCVEQGQRESFLVLYWW